MAKNQSELFVYFVYKKGVKSTQTHIRFPKNDFFPLLQHIENIMALVSMDDLVFKIADQQIILLTIHPHHSNRVCGQVDWAGLNSRIYLQKSKMINSLFVIRIMLLL